MPFPVLINGLVQAIKSNGEDRDIGLVNAVLHTVADEAKPYLAELKKSSALRDQALYWGSRLGQAQWSKGDMSIPEAKRLVKGSGMRTYLSPRLSRGGTWMNGSPGYTASQAKGMGITVP